MVRIVKCPGIAKDNGMTEVYGDWPLHGVPSSSMKNVRIRRRVKTKKLETEHVELGEEIESEDLV